MEQLFQNKLVADSETKFTAEEEYAESQFLETIRFKHGQYTINPLLREKCVPLQNNFNIAIHRYKSLRKRLKINPELEQQYVEAMNTLITNKEVEEVDDSEVTALDPTIVLYYIPHMPVIREDKLSTKIRPVFDASAKNNQGLSLNDQLIAGPKTQSSISLLMINVRLNPIVLLADLRRMFYSISYNPEPDGSMKGLKNNRDLYRFLWTDNKDEATKILRFITMLMGAKSSPYQAARVVQYHLEKIIKTSDDDEEIRCAEILLRHCT